MTPFLVAGLGNPGSEYELTRHNLGFRVVDALSTSSEFSFQSWKHERDVLSTLHTAGDERIFMIKPQGFMNESGIVVARFVNFYKIPLDRVVIIHDEIDLPFGEIRLAYDRGPAGHNGVSSIIEQLGSQAFHRVRVGVGSNREHNLPAEDYVLQKFSDLEEPLLTSVDGVIAQARDSVVKLVRSFHI